MRFDLDDLPDAVMAFLTERHLGALCTVRPDGTPHVVPVGFVFGTDRVVRIITQANSAKARHLIDGGACSVMQVDGGRWLTLEGTGHVASDPDGVARCVAAYTSRYQAPREGRATHRIGIEIVVTSIMGRV